MYCSDRIFVNYVEEQNKTKENWIFHNQDIDKISVPHTSRGKNADQNTSFFTLVKAY